MPPADPSVQAGDGGIAIRIDRPVLSRGRAVDVVRGALFIDGGASASEEITAIEIFVDGQYAAAARLGGQHHGRAGRGFHALIPPERLPDGEHRVRVAVRTAGGARAEVAFLVRVRYVLEESRPTVVRRKMPFAEIQMADRVLAGLAWRPHFDIIIAIGEVDEEIASARRTLASLSDQAYGQWRAVILRRGRRAPEQAAARLLDGFGGIADRIDIRFDAPAGALLADLVGAPPRQPQPDLVGVLLAGDVLGCDALQEMAIGSGLHPDAEFFYSDERRVSPASHASEAFFKPQWSPDLLTATNYIGRFWCALPVLLRRARLTMGDWFQFGDYELVLRLTEATSGIHHVAKLLCERGRPQIDHPDQERAALARALRRRGIDGEVSGGAVTGHYRVKRALTAPALVSVVIPTCAAEGRVKACIESLRALTAYRDIELIVVENIAEAQVPWKSWVREHADRVISDDGSFNWPRFNNLGAREARGEFLLFLKDDVEIVEPGWLDALLEHAQRDEVGVVGARLLGPDRTVQHAGIFWTPQGGSHAFCGLGGSDPGYFALARTERNVLAVTGACFLVRRTEFDAFGGFDESHSIVDSDVDFCLRCWERGKSVVYTPHATLLHHKGASQGASGDAFVSECFERRWGRHLRAGDPFHHPLLSRDRNDYAVDTEPIELVPSRRPLLDRAHIRNILAVKLDHIGDFVTAIPALQRLQQEFPQARVYLLASSAIAELTDLLPGLAGTIEFAFFFDQSGLGQRELSDADFQTLRQRLLPYDFDLAVDFRKAPETRPVLRCSCARWLAGFDHNGLYPWLDIAVEWETDRVGVRKRTPVGEDLLRLVDAVALAAEPTPGLPPQGVLASPELAPGVRRRLPAGRKIVCVHPGVGSPIRQWPAAHFAALIDLLAGSHDVTIVLVGSADEARIAADVMARVERRDVVHSVIGEIGLRELPELLHSVALFVGNDSGPKHLAAGLGVPTVGVHSGTVDAREWGPVGNNAVAIRRNMACSPCYLADPADCPRDLACLTELRPEQVYEVCRRLLAIAS